MATDAFIPIYSTTLSVAVPSVSIAGISQTDYRDLRAVVTYGLSVTGKQINFTVNNDTGANYTEVGATGYNGGFLAWCDVSIAKFSTMRATGVTLGELSTLVVDFLDFATDKHKVMLARSNHSGEVSQLAGRWASTSPISSIQFLPESGGGNLTAGTTITLFGIKA